MMIELIIISIILVGILCRNLKKPKNYPPGPNLLPIIGNLHYFSDDVLQMWKTLRRRYGDIVGLVVPKFNVVVVSGWSAVKEVLSNDDLQGRPDVCLLRDRFEGERCGLLFTDGEDHKVQRRFVLHHFRNLGFGRKLHEAVILEEAVSLGNEIEELEGRPIAMEYMFGISAVNIVWAIIGGRRYDRKDPVLLKLVKDVNDSIHNVQVFGNIAVIFPFLRYLFPNSTGFRALKSGCKGIIQFIRRTVHENEIDLKGDKAQKCFIEIYLQKLKEFPQEEQSSFQMSQLEGVCMDLLAAGSDTSSAFLSFAVLFLCLHPEFQSKIYDEILNVIGTNRLPSYEDKTSLVFTDAFLCEVLRFRYPVPTFPPHQATRDTHIKSYSIPTGTIIIPNIKSVFTDVAHWGDPQNFRPDRFLSEERTLKKDETLIFFGKGKRSCLGETLARMSSFLIFVSLVQRFSFSIPEGETPLNTKGSLAFTLAPPTFRVIATSRQPQKKTENWCKSQECDNRSF